MAPTDDRIGFYPFIESVRGATHADAAAMPAAMVQGSDEFDAMKQHILGLYEGVEVQHSFIDANGQIFDCIPIEQQPSLKGTEAQLPEPPDAPSAGAPAKHVGASAVVPPLHSDRIDRFGHPMVCPPGTIPMRRVTLEEMTQKETLRDFYRKAPGGRGRHPLLGPEIDAGVHKWAHGFQNVNNLGGCSFVNVWAPAVGSQIFSLCQHWYAGGSPVQTVEIGWQVYPAKYGTTNPVLFIYWTADGYQNTGCYNLDCSAFVQTNPHWPLGGALLPTSVSGGAQYELELMAFLSGGNWWLYVGGIAAADAIGYYPASLYGTGPLATNATSVDYGGEVVDQTAWPPMGSGAFANAGWQYAAYQRNIYYIGTDSSGTFASLSPGQDSANCFTIDIESAPDPWNEYFFFGGPGGTDCT